MESNPATARGGSLNNETTMDGGFDFRLSTFYLYLVRVLNQAYRRVIKSLLNGSHYNFL